MQPSQLVTISVIGRILTALPILRNSCEVIPLIGNMAEPGLCIVMEEKDKQS